MYRDLKYVYILDTYLMHVEYISQSELMALDVQTGSDSCPWHQTESYVVFVRMVLCVHAMCACI